MDRRAELEAAIEEDPQDHRAWAVYADCLQELEDPRGELIALSLAAMHDRGLEGVVHARRLANEHLFVPNIDKTVPDVRWKYGFVWRLVVGHPPAFDVGVLEHPSLRFVYELALRRVRDFNPAAAAISAVIRPTVRDLDIGVLPSGEEQEVTLNLEPLWGALPRLQRIKLRNVFVRAGIDSAPLKTLEYDGTTMHAVDLFRMLARSSWPKLERLEIACSGRSEPNHEAGVALMELVRDTELPALRHLAIRGGLLDQREPATLGMFAVGRVFERLETLDLSGNQLGDPDARMLVERRAMFPNLKTLEIAGNQLSFRGIERLGGLAPIVRGGGEQQVFPILDPEDGPPW